MLLLVIASTGCTRIAGPNFFHPGPTDYQQKRAERFDPYPDVMAGPAVESVRPREYQNPMPDVKRSQTNPQLLQPVVGF
jgi:hypothetical protein